MNSIEIAIRCNIAKVETKKHNEIINNQLQNIFDNLHVIANVLYYSHIQ